MKKLKIAFYGGCQLEPVVNAINLEFSDRAEVLEAPFNNYQVFSPFRSTHPTEANSPDGAAACPVVKAMHSFLDQADVIVMQPFLKISNTPIGRNNPKVQEFLHKTLMDKYANKKQIIGANVLDFKGYFLSKVYGYCLTEIIAFLYIQKKLTSSAQILKWLQNETCEEIHKLYLKNLKHSRDVHSLIEIALNEDFPVHVKQYDFEASYLTSLIATMPGHPTIVYYLKVLPDYMKLLLDVDLEEKDILKNRYKTLKRLSSHGAPYLPDFYFFKNIFPEISSNCFTPELAFKKISEEYIDEVLVRINSIDPRTLKGLFVGWADLKSQAPTP
jgi:hypothetical protein